VEWARTRTRHPWRFAALGSEEGIALRLASKVPPGTDSVLVVCGDRVLTKSDAVMAILADCRLPWRLGRWGGVLPRPWRDALYDLVARHRHRLSSKGCSIR